MQGPIRQSLRQLPSSRLIGRKIQGTIVPFLEIEGLSKGG